MVREHPLAVMVTDTKKSKALAGGVSGKMRIDEIPTTRLEARHRVQTYSRFHLIPPLLVIVMRSRPTLTILQHAQMAQATWPYPLTPACLQSDGLCPAPNLRDDGPTLRLPRCRSTRWQGPRVVPEARSPEAEGRHLSVWRIAEGSVSLKSQRAYASWGTRI